MLYTCVLLIVHFLVIVKNIITCYEGDVCFQPNFTFSFLSVLPNAHSCSSFVLRPERNSGKFVWEVHMSEYAVLLATDFFNMF